jgi:uncharacterized membrane protein
MRDRVEDGAPEPGTSALVPPSFWWWFAFGFPAFGAVVAIFWLMIARPQTLDLAS